MKSPRNPAVRRDMNMRLDRHSGTGTRGLPKKDGAGGKTVWGDPSDQDPVTCLDKNDPNYDSDSADAAPGPPPDLSLTPAGNPKSSEQASTDKAPADSKN